jgi:hypothetical protein
MALLTASNHRHIHHRLKWKPPSENSIDFKLVLRFPPSSERPQLPDLFAKPIFQLHVWCGGNKYELYDTMEVTDDEWERSVNTSVHTFGIFD